MARLVLFLPVLVLAPVLTAGSLQERQSAADLRAAIDSFVERRIAQDEFSGAILVARNGSVLYQRAAGMANRDAGLPVTIDTRLQIASTTKLYTQIAIRQLEQAGKLSLDDTVGKFLPVYPNAIVRGKVTINQLLRHRSGVGSFWNERYMARRAEVRSVNDYLELFQHDSLLFVPGTDEAYSNGGYVLLGAIIEKVSGQSYHDYLRDRIFQPAGMSNTMPYDSRVRLDNAGVGYTGQMMDGAVSSDPRLAGSGARPGYDVPAGASAQPPRSAPDSANAAGGRRLRIMGPDGRELSQEEARAARERRAAAGGQRRPNTSFQAGMSSPAGNHYSTVGDFLKLADALLTYRLLDSTRTRVLLGARYAGGSDFRANGGGPGVNAEFSIYPSGDVIVVLSNYDPPAATTVAEQVRGLLVKGQRGPSGSGTAQATPAGLRQEIDALLASMVAALKADPASVAKFYTDDASILGGGSRYVGREEVNRYWREATMFADWTLEIIEAGGEPQAPWVRGRSTLVGKSGRRMATEFIGLLKRQPDGRLRFYVDMFVAATPGVRRPGS